MCLIVARPPRPRSIPGSGRRRYEQSGQTHEVVGDGCEGEQRLDRRPPPQLDLPHPGSRLDPAEGLLDPLAAAQADRIAGVARGAAVDGDLAHLAGLRHRPVDGDVRRHPPRPQIADEGLHVEQLVRAQRDPVPTGAAVEHEQGRLALGRAGGVSEAGVHHQAVAVLHQRVAEVAQPALPAVRLAVEARAPGR